MTTLRISQLLLDLYSCPAERNRWPAVLDQLCRTLHARSAVLQVLIPDNERLRSRWMVRDSRSEAAGALHDRYFSDAVNPRLRVKRSVATIGEGIFRDSDFFSPDDPLWSDLKVALAATGLGHFISSRVRLPDGDALTLVLHRDAHDEQDFSGRDERLALHLMPHLRQAVELTGTMLEAQGEVRYLRQSMDSLRLGLAICDKEASLCWMNQAAEQLLTRHDVLWLNQDRQLTTRSMKETQALRSAITRAARDTVSEDDLDILVLRGNAGEALQVRCHGLGCDSGEGRVLLMLRDPNSDSSLAPELLRQLFGLSPAESRLAAALCIGSTLDEYAARAGVAIGTARYQLKQVMAKTEVSKQSQLVQRLCTSVIFHMRHQKSQPTRRPYSRGAP